MPDAPATKVEAVQIINYIYANIIQIDVSSY